MQKDFRIQNQQRVSFAEVENSESNLFFAFHKATSEYKNVWYLDYGCSYMIGDKNSFFDINRSFGTKIKLGNEEYVEVEGKGSIKVATKQGGKVIYGTLYVSKLDERRVISVVKMTKSINFPPSLNYEKNINLMTREEGDSYLRKNRLGHLNYNSLTLLP